MVNTDEAEEREISRSGNGAVPSGKASLETRPPPQIWINIAWLLVQGPPL